MNHWAKSAKYDCNFLCICVVGDRGAVSLAREMGKQSQLTHCVNGFIDNDAGMPNYGQLGCQGFIVLDPQHQVVSAGTSAFMQVRDLAFKHVETLLDAVCSERSPPAVCPGEYVMLTQAPADKPKLAGQQGICVNLQQDIVTMVLLAGSYRGKQIQVPASHVRKVDEDSDDEETGTGGGQGGCGQGSCGQGPCGQGNCATQGDCGKADCEAGGYGGQASPGESNRRVDPSVVNSALQLISVKVPSMDHEHDECAFYLRELAEYQSRSALEAATKCLLEHFEHEEALFVEHGFGGNVDDRFSAKKSHIDEHRRITTEMQRKIAEVGSNPVPAEFIEKLLKDFHEHTSRYDVQYAEFLSSKGAQ